MTEQAPEQFGRRSIRLKGYDYSQAGGYYVTIVTQLRESFFGKICGGEMIFNDAGRMVNIEWGSLQERFPNIETDVFQVMPNHLHGIIIIHNHEPVGAGLVPAHAIRATTRVAPTLGEIVGAFKSITTHKYIQGVDEFAWPVFYKRLWQRNYEACPERSEGNISSATRPITNA
jgi:REP element-mobilizing transposase RayT